MSAFIVVVVLVLVASPFCVFMSFNEEIAFFCVCVLLCVVVVCCCGCAIKNEKMKKKVESKSGKNW